MSQEYSDPKRENDPYALPDVEIFQMSVSDFISAESDTWMAEMMREKDIEQNVLERAKELSGFYYWACFPGCLPDSDPFGPFETYEQALESAQADSDDDDSE